VKASTLEEIENSVIAELANAEAEALISREKNMPRPETAIQGVYADLDAARAGKSL